MTALPHFKQDERSPSTGTAATDETAAIEFSDSILEVLGSPVDESKDPVTEHAADWAADALSSVYGSQGHARVGTPSTVSCPQCSKDTWFPTTTIDTTATPTGILYTCYHFLELGNLSNLSPRDVNLLESQSCLRVPTREVLGVFMQQYFRYVHPFLPIIHEGDFWRLCCRSNTGDSGNANEAALSLLLLQAMLFASSNVCGQHRAFSTSHLQSLSWSPLRHSRLLGSVPFVQLGQTYTAEQRYGILNLNITACTEYSQNSSFYMTWVPKCPRTRSAKQHFSYHFGVLLQIRWVIDRTMSGSPLPSNAQRMWGLMNIVNLKTVRI